MHVTVRHYVGNRKLVDALVENEDEIRGIITGIDGYKAYYLLRTEDGDALSISVYESEEGGKESVGAARDWIAQNLPEMHISPPSVTAGEAVLVF
jgi:hypothetical protein